MAWKSPTVRRAEEKQQAEQSAAAGGRSRPKQASGFSDRPSARLNPRAATNPFAKESSARTPFAKAYVAGAIPCRIDHGCHKHKLKWDREPTEMDSYDPLLVHIAEGLSETKHPYVFVARTAFTELLMADGGVEKTRPLTGQLARPLRMALTSRDDAVFKAALQAVRLLAECVGEDLAPSLQVLLVQISKKSFQPKFKAVIVETLTTISEHCGPEAAGLIKKKCPTFAT
eukprot:g187.t1